MSRIRASQHPDPAVRLQYRAAQQASFGEEAVADLCPACGWQTRVARPVAPAAPCLVACLQCGSTFTLRAQPASPVQEARTAALEYHTPQEALAVAHRAFEAYVDAEPAEREKHGVSLFAVLLHACDLLCRGQRNLFDGLSDLDRRVAPDVDTADEPVVPPAPGETSSRVPLTTQAKALLAARAAGNLEGARAHGPAPSLAPQGARAVPVTQIPGFRSACPFCASQLRADEAGLLVQALVPLQSSDEIDVAEQLSMRIPAANGHGNFALLPAHRTCAEGRGYVHAVPDLGYLTPVAPVWVQPESVRVVPEATDG